MATKARYMGILLLLSFGIGTLPIATYSQGTKSTWSVDGTVTHRDEPVKAGGYVFMMNATQFNNLFTECYETATGKGTEGTSAAYHCAADGDSKSSVAMVATSSSDGSYQFENLPEDTYYIVAVASMADKKTCLNSGCFVINTLELTSNHTSVDINIP